MLYGLKLLPVPGRRLRRLRRGRRPGAAVVPVPNVGTLLGCVGCVVPPLPPTAIGCDVAARIRVDELLLRLRIHLARLARLTGRLRAACCARRCCSK